MEILFLDIQDERLTNFRKKVIYNDCCNFPSDVLDTYYNYNKLQNIVNHNDFENGWRYTASKFESTKFHHILGFFYKGEIVSLSCAIKTGDYLKIGVFHYTLKNYRADFNVRGLLYRKQGFVDYHESVIKKENLKGMYLTIYPHNRQLHTYVNFLKRGPKTLENHDMSNIYRVKYSGSAIFKNVNQEVFHFDTINTADLLLNIKNYNDKPR